MMANTEKKESVQAAQGLLQSSNKAAFGTVMSDGSPLVTLVAMVTTTEGTPLVLLSQLAVHTQNILRDPRASLLIETQSAGDDPMTGARLSLTGRLVALEEEEVTAAKARFIARHANAEPYDRQLDFNYYRFDIVQGRFNQGFGRFRKLGPTDLLTDNLAPQ